MTDLVLQRTGSSTQYEVIADGQIVGRISLVGVLQNKPWMWSIDFTFSEGHEPLYGFEATRVKPRCSPSRRAGSAIEGAGFSQCRGGMRVLPLRLTRCILAQAGHRSETYTLSSGTSSANQTCTFWPVVAQR